MAIKAKIPSGQNSFRTNPMWQWDYGQTLEIEAENLPSLIEVHFACREMTEAVVHTCSAVNGVATVAIPDRCLEQTSDITAWVYEIDGTAGRTIYSVTIPITARTRPARSESIPQTVQDTYTQLITEVNELLASLQNGGVNVGYANTAGSALHAATAKSAETATSANTAGIATTAVNDSNGNKISDTYMKIPEGYTVLARGENISEGFYHFIMVEKDSDLGYSFFMDFGSTGYHPQNMYSPVAAVYNALHRVTFTIKTLGLYTYSSIDVGTVSGSTFSFSPVGEATASYYTLYYKKLSTR